MGFGSEGCTGRPGSLLSAAVGLPPSDGRPQSWAWGLSGPPWKSKSTSVLGYPSSPYSLVCFGVPSGLYVVEVLPGVPVIGFDGGFDLLKRPLIALMEWFIDALAAEEKES